MCRVKAVRVIIRTVSRRRNVLAARVCSAIVKIQHVMVRSTCCCINMCRFRYKLFSRDAGGACTFDSCYDATCKGGGCNFINPPRTLTEGYCHGHGCKINGNEHPHLQQHLSL
jgi:hypothetical protein